MLSYRGTDRLDPTAYKSRLLFAVSDPTIAQGPAKKSKKISAAQVRIGRNVILSRATTPLSVEPGDNVMIVIDNNPAPLVAVLPTETPTEVDSIRFRPMGNLANTPLHIVSTALPIAGTAPDADGVTVVCNSNEVFELQWTDETNGFWPF